MVRWFLSLTFECSGAGTPNAFCGKVVRELLIL